jgi:hypothetical protein
MVRAVVPGCHVRYAEGGGPDPRCYRVDCSKIARLVPAFRPRWTVEQGVSQLYDAYRDARLTRAVFQGDRYQRIKHIQRLIDEARLDSELRWQSPVQAEAIG